MGEPARVLFDAAGRDDQHKYYDGSLRPTGRGSSRAASGGPPPLEIRGRGGWDRPGFFLGASGYTLFFAGVRSDLGGVPQTQTNGMDQTIDLTTDSSDVTGHTNQLRTESRGKATHHRPAADFEAHLDLAAKIALDVVKELDHVRRYVAPIGGFAHVSRNI